MAGTGIPIRGEELQILRRRKRLTQEALARRVGVSHIQIVRIEGGSRNPSPDLLDRLIALFGEDQINSLITDEGHAVYEPRAVML